MEKEMDPNIIKTTQKTLGKYFKKPVLSEKLLKKPPFRFLHDIITSVIKTTGFFEGLFDEHELISENVKDRESKIRFLTKVIAVLGNTTGSPLSVKPSKIVAGQEPEKTNELLQCLALALDKKMSSLEAVKAYKTEPKSSQVTENIKDVKPQKKSVDNKSLTSKSNEKLSKTKKEIVEKSLPKNEKDKSNVKKTKQRDNNPTNKKPAVLNKVPSTDKVQKENSNSKISQQPPDQEIEKSNHSSEKLEIRNTVETDIISHEHSSDILNIDEDKLNNVLSSSETINNENVSISAKVVEPERTEVDAPTGSLNEIEDIRPEVNNDNVIDVNNHIKPMNLSKIDSSKLESNYDTKTFRENAPGHTPNDQLNINIIRPSSMRPSSSRPGAPRVKQKHENNISENVLLGKVNIIVESTTNDDDESSIIIVDEPETLNTNIGYQEELPLSSTQKSTLVQQILDSQRELSNVAGKTEIEWQFGNQKLRDSLNKEIEQLRFNIQALSRVAGPLGKLLDHIQEDVEVMRQELFHWSTTYEDTSKELTKQKIENEELLHPFYWKLKKLNADIDERHEKINDIKTIVYKNSCKIDKLLIASGTKNIYIEAKPQRFPH